MTTSHNNSPTRGAVADIFSSYVAATAISALEELGALDRLEADGEFSLSTFDSSIDERVLFNLLNALSWAGIVKIQGDKVWPGERFAEAYALRGYFYWLVRGCGEIFSIAPHVAVSGNRHGEFYTRNMRAVAIGSRLIGDPEVEPLFDQILNDLGTAVVADLGCGSGQRLIRIAQNNPNMRGIGVDIAPAAVNLANESVAGQGLSDRIRVYRDDVLHLSPRPSFAEVDVVTCVFMGHDFWPKQRCVATLRGLRRAFPNASKLLICDVVRATTPPGENTPVFQLGFETVHALMGVYLPTLAEWHEAFAEAGWQVDSVTPTDGPPGGFLFNLSPAAIVAQDGNAGVRVLEAVA